MKIRTLSTVFTLLVPFVMFLGAERMAAQTPQISNEDIQRERRVFDFLIGDWVIEKSETPKGTEVGGDDEYKFERILDGSGIMANWHFNRGTKAKPDYTNAIYVSAFDNSTKVWSFYYVSERSAQWYEGRKENGEWFFYKKLLVNGQDLLQRQEWKLKDQSTLLRTIENSSDGGKTWIMGVVYTLKRKG